MAQDLAGAAMARSDPGPYRTGPRSSGRMGSHRRNSKWWLRSLPPGM